MSKIEVKLINTDNLRQVSHTVEGEASEALTLAALVQDRASAEDNANYLVEYVSVDGVSQMEVAQ